MRKDKYERAMAEYEGHKGSVSVQAVWEQIPADIREQLTGKQLGVVMNLINNAYHKGKADAGAEKVDVDCVWVDGYGLVDLPPKE